MRHLAAPGYTGRQVPRIPTAPAPQAPDRAEPAAPADPSLAGAAFSHFTESLDVGARFGDEGRPVHPTAGRPLHLSDHSMILLRAVANYEQCSNEHAVALALAAYATAIGAGPLARAVLDERERVGRGRSNCSAGEDVTEDLGDLPDFERRQIGRFSRAREALGDSFQGKRR